jgi:pimeloyl-ACP methyl ester carboxylesterase
LESFWSKAAHAFVKGFLFQAGLNDPARLTELTRRPILRHILRGRPGRESSLFHVRSRPGQRAQSVILWQIEGAKLEAAFANKPVKIVWPMKDVAFSSGNTRGHVAKAFPHAEVTRVEDAGHFIQEDAHEIVIPELMDFIGGSLTPSGRSR